MNRSPESPNSRTAQQAASSGKSAPYGIFSGGGTDGGKQLDLLH
jgi:hypothetical protein